MKYTWIENGRIRDICPGNPGEIYHPEIAKFYTSEVPDDAENGDLWDGANLIKFVPSVPSSPEPASVKNPRVGPIEFKVLWTVQERLALKGLRTTDEILEDFFSIVDDPRLSYIDLDLRSTKDAVSYAVNALVTAGITNSDDAADRISAILSGVAV